MAKPPVFDSGTWQRQKDLLAAEDRHLQSKADWGGALEALALIGSVLVLVVALGSVVVGLFG